MMIRFTLSDWFKEVWFLLLIVAFGTSFLSMLLEGNLFGLTAILFLCFGYYFIGVRTALLSAFGRKEGGIKWRNA